MRMSDSLSFTSLSPSKQDTTEENVVGSFIARQARLFHSGRHLSKGPPVREKLGNTSLLVSAPILLNGRVRRRCNSTCGI
jgi:hypothetical protein